MFNNYSARVATRKLKFGFLNRIKLKTDIVFSIELNYSNISFT